MATDTCLRCGAFTGVGNPQPVRCGECPPRPCADCGEPDNAPCSCYTPVNSLTFADLKAHLAASDLTLETPR